MLFYHSDIWVDFLFMGYYLYKKRGRMKNCVFCTNDDLITVKKKLVHYANWRRTGCYDIMMTVIYLVRLQKIRRQLPLPANFIKLYKMKKCFANHLIVMPILSIALLFRFVKRKSLRKEKKSDYLQKTEKNQLFGRCYTQFIFQ